METQVAALLERLSHPTQVLNSDDAALDDVRDLNHSDRRPDLPGGKGLVIAEGLLVVPRLLESRFPVRAIVGTRSKLESLRMELDERLHAVGPAAILGGGRVPEVLEVTREVLRGAAGFDMHRGLVAAADRAPEMTSVELLDFADARDMRGGTDVHEQGHVQGQVPAQAQDSQVLAVLEGVGDHENLGALFRNAAGIGVSGVLFGAATADPLYRRAVRVSMGHVLRLPFAHLGGTTTTWQRELSLLVERGYVVIALTPNTDLSLQEAVVRARELSLERQRTHATGANDSVAVRPKIAILVGAEGPGLTEHAMRACDFRATIPMMPGADSLNVATAAAIGFYSATLH